MKKNGISRRDFLKGAAAGALSTAAAGILGACVTPSENTTAAQGGATQENPSAGEDNSSQNNNFAPEKNAGDWLGTAPVIEELSLIHI